MVQIREYFCNFLENNNFKYVCQSEFSEIYSDIFFYICGKVNINDLFKIFRINYCSSENNLMKFIYPVLMAIDILLFSPCTVVVASDQIHNIRYVKSLLKKLCLNDINVEYDVIDKKILSINSLKKMSTSDINTNKILIDDDYNSIYNSIKKVKTCTNIVEKYDQLNSHLINLFNIIGTIQNKNTKQLFDSLHFNSYLQLKKYFSDQIYDYLQQYRKKNDQNSKCRVDFSNIKEIINKNSLLIKSR